MFQSPYLTRNLLFYEALPVQSDPPFGLLPTARALRFYTT
jgi:hypothetical protein